MTLSTQAFVEVLGHYEVWWWWQGFFASIFFARQGWVQCRQGECHWAFSFPNCICFDVEVAEPSAGFVLQSWAQWPNFPQDSYIPGR
jgi:hypothetical protein